RGESRWPGAWRADGDSRRGPVCLVYRHRGQPRGHASADPAQFDCAERSQAEGRNVTRIQSKVNEIAAPFAKTGEMIDSYAWLMTVAWRFVVQRRARRVRRLFVQ